MFDLIDLIAHEYHWSEQQILNTPLVRIVRYQRAIAVRHGVKETSGITNAEIEFMRSLEAEINGG